MRSVLITGGAKNTGLATANKFAGEGWAVFIVGRNEEEAGAAAKDIEEKFHTPCFGIMHDINDVDMADVLFDQVHEKGYVLDSIILNAAAQGLNTDPLTVNIAVWEAVIRCNVTGGFSLARAFAKDAISNDKSREATIVFLSSINYAACIPQRSSYCASKGGIVSMTKALAMDFGQYGIRVNCVAPGPIYTDRYDKLTEDVRKWRDSQVPIGRISTGEDVANSVYFMATELSGNIHGECMIIDGGLAAQNSGRF